MLAGVGVKLPAVITALQVLTVKASARERHTAVRAGIAQGKRLSLAIAADHQRRFEQHGFVQTIAGHLSAGQGATPEAVEHQRVRRLTLGGFQSAGFRSAGFEFVRLESLAHEESQAAYYSREVLCRRGSKSAGRAIFPLTRLKTRQKANRCLPVARKIEKKRRPVREFCAI